MTFSFDGHEWHPTSYFFTTTLRVRNTPALNQREIDALNQLLDSNVTVPLWHELYLEARQLEHTNPRSSLVIAVAAIEAGFKEYVAEIIPNSAWLLQELPTPPLGKWHAQK